MFFQSAPPAIIVELAPRPSDEMTFADVILGAFGLTGALVAIAMVLGVVMAVVLVRWNRRHRPEEDHMPHISS
jgi:ABC-type phosphate transport system permease subunit